MVDVGYCIDLYADFARQGKNYVPFPDKPSHRVFLDDLRVAGFLMRCLFTMFAEDVGLLPERSFTGLLADYRGNLDAFPKALEHLWRTMDTGGFEPGLKADVQRFNGRLFH